MIELADVCRVQPCPVRDLKVARCPEPAVACAQVWASTDPQDMGAYEDWPADNRSEATIR